MARKKRKKRDKKTAPEPPTQKPPIPRSFFTSPAQEPIEEKIGRHVDIERRRKLKELAGKPLPGTMSAADIEEELRELLGDD